VSARRILLVAQIAPPSPMSGARRIAGLTRHLARLGHEVTVLTSVVSGSGPVPGAGRTVRTRDLMVSPLNWRRSNFAALQGGSQGAYDPRPSALASIAVPDLEVIGWLPFALEAALRLVRSTPIDCVVTSAPPRSGHLIGLALHARGVPWVADFRDGWSFDVPDRPRYPLRAQRALDRTLEGAVARRADALTAVTDPIAEDLRARLEGHATTITNGFDPLEEVAPDVSSLLRPGRVSLVYTGSLAYGGSHPDSLLAAVRRLVEERPDLAASLDLVFAGALGAGERAAIEDPALGGVARTVGALSRPDTLALQRAADALAVLAPDRRPSVATGKLYEYLAARRPILVLGERSEAARIVRRAEAGLVVPDDERSAAAALDAVVAGRLPAPTAEAVAPFSYEQLADELSSVVAEAISWRSARDSLIG
jgi:glycosyltransferase involved in cell wall biosynthesis